MNLQQRIEVMVQLGNYIKENNHDWMEAKKKAEVKNPWFIPEFTQLASDNISESFLQRDLLQKWAEHYHLDDNIQSRNVGIVMAGNIPMVGFHDLLSVFISGHRQTIKLSSKDDVLIRHLIDVIFRIEPSARSWFDTADVLKGCEAYIATGSNNTSRYFEQYFGKYPHIIRKNKTSVAILGGNESVEELNKLADDIHVYFGLGCRNITKLFVPENYDFIPLLRSFDKYAFFMDLNRYKNNFDFQLSLLLLNKMYYMTNGNTLLVEHKNNFSPISVLNYEYYPDSSKPVVMEEEVQCIAGDGNISFGKAQNPGLFDYADQIDTMQFLVSIG